MSIERYMCGVKKLDGYSQPYMSLAVQGEYVRHSDHLEALGEARKDRDDLEEDLADVLLLKRSLEDQLATLRSEIAYVRGHLGG